MTTEHTKKTPSYTNHNGFLMPFGFPAHNFSKGTAYQHQAEDLFVVTYPKCGTTLTQHMVYLMLNDGVPVQPNEELNHLFPHLEEVGAPTSAAMKNGTRLLKTHLHYEMMNVSPEAKYIFVVRNPKDCVVSFFHHTRGFPKHYDFEDGDFDVYFDLFCKGEVDFGDYFQMLRSSINRKDDENALFLTYESIQDDKEGALLKIAKFLGGGMDDKLLQDDKELMNKIVKHSSIVEMKKHPLRWSSERKVKHSPFIRAGNVGGWSELLTQQQGEILDEMMRKNFTQEELNYLGPKYT